MTRGKLTGLLLLLAASSTAALLFAQANCPPQGSALFSRSPTQFVLLKNRVEPPRPSDFDERVTLEALLRPGDDRARWSDARAAAVEGYVVRVGAGGVESANCYSLTWRDTHVYMASRPEAPERERVVLEVTPRVRDRMRRQGADWTEEALRRELVGRWCRVEGWLLFDLEHADEAENTAPGRAGNWRATAWELHPVTRIEVLR